MWAGACDGLISIGYAAAVASVGTNHERRTVLTIVGVVVWIGQKQWFVRRVGVRRCATRQRHGGGREKKILRDPHRSQNFILAAARAVTCYASCRVAIEFGSVSNDGRELDAFNTRYERNLDKNNGNQL
jgi:hypothetical protein